MGKWEASMSETIDKVVRLPFVASTRAALASVQGRFGTLHGSSAPMQEVYRRIERAAPTTVTVLITGESGSGKDVVARTIHQQSPRASRPYVAINCAATPRNLIEAELFGYEKGAFTGALRSHRGCFERADGGTLFLDEITEMAPEMQVRLLRLLETGCYTRLGGEEQLSARARIVAATHRDPRQAVRDGRLRGDLMYRIAVFPIHVPGLRERDGDPEVLAEHFLGELNRANATRKKFSRHAIGLLRSYHWPGNVRELQNAVERAYILCDDLIEIEVAGLAGLEPVNDCVRVPIGTPLAAMERQVICATLELCQGNKRRCAEMLGVSLKTLYNRLAEYHTTPAVTATM